VYTATTAVGFVGVLNGMREGNYSVSINARGKGGKILENIEEALLHASMTPSQVCACACAGSAHRWGWLQHLRHVFETADSYASALAALSAGAYAGAPCVRACADARSTPFSKRRHRTNLAPPTGSMGPPERGDL
jgi:hypothetical protein